MSVLITLLVNLLIVVVVVSLAIWLAEEALPEGKPRKIARVIIAAIALVWLLSAWLGHAPYVHPGSVASSRTAPFATEA